MVHHSFLSSPFADFSCHGLCAFDYVLPSLTGSASADAEGSAGAASWKLDGDTKLSTFVLDTLLVDPEVGTQLLLVHHDQGCLSFTGTNLR